MKVRTGTSIPAKPWRPHSAMVLAAGMGTRMRPLTDQVPKPLVRVKGRPLVDHVLDRIGDAGIGHAVVNVHYMADKLTAHLKGRTQPEITISEERDALLDTGGGVVRALPKLGGGAFLVHNADSTWIEGVGSNIARLCEAWNDETMDFLLLVALASSSVGYDGRGDFNMQADGLMIRRAEREMAPFAFTGVSIAHPRAFKDAPAGAFSLNALWSRAIENQRLYGVRLDGIWMHIGTPEAVTAAEARIDEPNG
jgi:N-acetyl-alpha-D-muramate 1-phosphate uridylyltransferase